MLSDYFHVQLHPSIGIVLPLDNTTEVISLPRREICPIPGVSPALLGVVNQCGRFLWVLELSHLLKLAQPTTRVSQDNLTLIVLTSGSTDSTSGQSERRVGCVVSALKGIIPLNSAKFKPVPTKFASSIGSFLSGIAEVEHSSVAVLSVSAVLANLHTSVPTTSMVSL